MIFFSLQAQIKYRYAKESQIKKRNISGQRIREARKKLGIGQEDLAAALRISYGIEVVQSDISELERCVRGVKDYELNAIAWILDVRPSWLLRGDNSSVDKED